MGFEALVRWRNATGDVLPGEFIPLAEEVGLVVPIGRFVFVDACRRLADWRRQAPALDLRMHVNLSVQEVLEPDLDAFVARNLRRFGLSSDDIVLEITESAVIRSNTLSLGSLARLRATGVHLCIDDFGTGYSSLRYLHQLPFDAMKIDRSFVESEDGGLGSAPIVRMLMQLARSYGIDVVAEGVETARQAEELMALDCEYAQGFHFYRPMGADAVTALLETVVPASRGRLRRATVSRIRLAASETSASATSRRSAATNSSITGPARPACGRSQHVAEFAHPRCRVQRTNRGVPRIVRWCRRHRPSRCVPRAASACARVERRAHDVAAVRMRLDAVAPPRRCSRRPRVERNCKRSPSRRARRDTRRSSARAHRAASE